MIVNESVNNNIITSLINEFSDWCGREILYLRNSNTLMGGLVALVAVAIAVFALAYFIGAPGLFLGVLCAFVLVCTATRIVFDGRRKEQDKILAAFIHQLHDPVNKLLNHLMEDDGSSVGQNVAEVGQNVAEKENKLLLDMKKDQENFVEMKNNEDFFSEVPKVQKNDSASETQKDQNSVQDRKDNPKKVHSNSIKKIYDKILKYSNAHPKIQKILKKAENYFKADNYEVKVEKEKLEEIKLYAEECLSHLGGISDHHSQWAKKSIETY